MDEVSRSPIFVAIISDNYFGSFNCMVELSGLFENSSDLNSLFPIMIEKSIRKDDDFYVAKSKHWAKEFKKVSNLLVKKGCDNNLVDKFNDLACIIRNFTKIREYFEHTLIDDIDKMRNNSFADFTEQIVERANNLLRITTPNNKQIQLSITMPYEHLNYFENILKMSSVQYRIVENVKNFDTQSQAGSSLIVNDNPIQINALVNNIISNGYEKHIIGLTYKDSAKRIEDDLDSLSDIFGIMQDDEKHIDFDISSASNALRVISDSNLLSKSDIQSVYDNLNRIKNEHN